ncbi:hypothetical protein ACET57_19280 [Aeromonas veronii]|uniref:Uncharacterized protein n=1 Tax=Aeromonas allosaccharophila TaxID=656 RepID=A0ABZ0FCW4_9GAMM|nr:hypothetical protein [Aeromonas allosaccharophila]WOE67424.1 hypothetical protein RY972_04885 [Aeromonas allosaccharophila]
MKELTIQELNFVSGGWQSRGATSSDMGSPHEGRGGNRGGGNGGNNPYNDRKGAIDKYDGRGAADLGIKIGRFFGGVGMTEADIRNMRDNNRGSNGGSRSSSGRGDGGNGRGGSSSKN